MSLINSGRKTFFKSSQGGIRKVYLSGFVPYQRNQFSFNGNVLTSIPTTFVYEFELNGSGNRFTSSFQSDSYNQTLNLEFKKQDLETTIQMEALNYMELRALILDNNGNYLLFGLDNGLTSDGLNIVSGGARADFNGYRLTLQGKEKHQTPFVLNPFEIGFILAEENEDFYQFQDLEAFLFQDGTPYYFN